MSSILYSRWLSSSLKLILILISIGPHDAHAMLELFIGHLTFNDLSGRTPDSAVNVISRFRSASRRDSNVADQSPFGSQQNLWDKLRLAAYRHFLTTRELMAHTTRCTLPIHVTRSLRQSKRNKMLVALSSLCRLRRKERRNRRFSDFWSCECCFVDSRSWSSNCPDEGICFVGSEPSRKDACHRDQ